MYDVIAAILGLHDKQVGRCIVTQGTRHVKDPKNLVNSDHLRSSEYGHFTICLFASDRSERVFSNESKGYSECPSVRVPPPLHPGDSCYKLIILNNCLLSSMGAKN